MSICRYLVGRDDDGAPLGFAGSMRCRTARRSVPTITASPGRFYGSDHVREIGQETRRNRMPRMPHLFYSHRSKVNRRNVKCCLRCSINGRGRQTNDVIGSQATHNVREQAERRAPARWPALKQPGRDRLELQRRKGIGGGERSCRSYRSCHSLFG